MARQPRVVSFLSRNRHRLSPLLVVPHDYPDPDAIASALALRFLAAEVCGIRTVIAYGGVIGRTENREMVEVLKIPMRNLKSSHYDRYSNIALVDTQPGFGNNSFPPRRIPTMIIDQHEPLAPLEADFVHINRRAGATSTLLAQAILRLNQPIPSKLATALVYGILSDTLNLSRAGSRVDIQTYLALLPHADVRALARIQNPRRSRQTLATLGRGIRNANLAGRVIVSHLGEVENPDLVSQVADFILSCRGMRAAFCTGRYKNHLYLSLRLASEGRPASNILRAVVGNPRYAGGHGRIAGGAVPLNARPMDSQWRRLEISLTRQVLKGLGAGSARIVRHPLRK